jgi:hypothetical protein
MDNLFNSHLIVLDGLPGSGKTTTGQWLTARLQAHGLKAYWLPEAEISHPLWWYQHWNGMEYQPPDFKNTPIEAFIQNSLGKWKDFTESALATDRLIVAESVFFQNAVAMFLMGGAMPGRLVEYAQAVQEIARNLNPVMIYFRQDDPAASLKRICAVRGEAFQDELIHNMEKFPYLSQRGLKGLDGIAMLWSDICTLTDGLFEKYTTPKLSFETSDGNWQKYRQQILEFLGIPFTQL